MDISLDIIRLEKLLSSLYTITGHKFGIFDTKFKELYTASEQTPFCRLIKDTPYGYEKCRNCDAESFKIAKKRRDIYIYRCHAGILEVCAPITESGEVIAYLMYGQILDDTPYEEQWKRTREKCRWHHDLELLKEYFFQLRQVSNAKQIACAEIMSACTSYIWLKGVVKIYQQTEAQRLASYINHNYEKNITLGSIANALNISKTKLCTLAKSQLGKTVGELIAQKRVEAAKVFLQTSDLLISEISSRVGISDYNYFSRLFKLKEGLTPSEFRVRYRISVVPNTVEYFTM